MKIEFLPYFSIWEILNLCRLCKEIYVIIESNKCRGSKPSMHFTNLAVQQGIFKKSLKTDRSQFDLLMKSDRSSYRPQSSITKPVKTNKMKNQASSRNFPSLMTLGDIGQLHIQIRQIVSKMEESPKWRQYDTDDFLKQYMLQQAWSFIPFESSHSKFIKSQSIFSIYSDKENPLLQRLTERIATGTVKYVEMDIDNKIMGSFMPCRFEML